MTVIGAVFREITGAVLVFCGGEFLFGDIVRYFEDETAGIVKSDRLARWTAAGGIGAEVVKGEFFHGKLPGLLGSQLVNGELEVFLQIVGGKELFIRLIIDDGEAAAFQLVHPIDKAPQLDALDIYGKVLFQGHWHAEIGVVNLPEFGEDFLTVLPVLRLFFRRFVPQREPVLGVMGKQVFQGGRRRCIYPEKELDAVMQGGSEAEIPFIFWLESVNIPQLVGQGTGLVKRNLGETKRPDFYLP